MKGRGRHCEICGKGRMERHLVSHAKNNFVRYAKPNLHRARVMLKGRVQSVLVCASCIKRGKNPRVPARILTRPAAAK
jgi:ribosomal protein L28